MILKMFLDRQDNNIFCEIFEPFKFCKISTNITNNLFLIKGNGVNKNISRNEQPLSEKNSIGNRSNHSSNEATNNSFLILNPHPVRQNEEKNNLCTSREEIENVNSSLRLHETLANTALPDVVVHQDFENLTSDQVNF